MTRSFKTSFTTTGPFFKRDPARTLGGNIHTMMLTLAREGAKEVRRRLRVGEGGRAPIRALGGRVSARVTGELRRYPRGPRYSARVFVRNRRMSREQGISLMAAASYLEGTVHAFARTRSRIMRARAINAAELTKGM